METVENQHVLPLKSGGTTKIYHENKKCLAEKTIKKSKTEIISI